MSNTSSTPAVPLARKYRVQIRELAKEAGWSFRQTSTATDRFEREGTVVEVHHGKGDRIAAAEIAGPDHTDQLPGKSRGKWFVVREWLTGDTSRTYKPLDDETVAKYESNKGIALVKTMAPKEVAEPKQS
jgi:hypothetical protein